MTLCLFWSVLRCGTEVLPLCYSPPPFFFYPLSPRPPLTFLKHRIFSHLPSDPDEEHPDTMSTVKPRRITPYFLGPCSQAGEEPAQAWGRPCPGPSEHPRFSGVGEEDVQITADTAVAIIAYDDDDDGPSLQMSTSPTPLPV